MKPPVWILLIALPAAAADWHTEPGHRWREVSVTPGKPGFTFLTADATGIQFTNTLDDRTSITNRNLLSGSGVALGDVDGDGRCDIYFCALEAGNRLYRNLGNLRFEDITTSAGVGCPGQFSTGATLVDIDGDGDLDLLVNSFGHGTRLFLNDGHAHYTEVTRDAGLESRTGSTSIALADIDGDGDLDLYVCNFRPTAIIDRPGTQFRIETGVHGPEVASVDGRPVTEPDLTNRFVVSPSGGILELGEEDALYRNDGGGRFTRIPFTDGTFMDESGRPLREPPRDWGLAAQFHDINGDGYPDLYVCNDLFTPDRIWLNDGHGRFRAMSMLALRNNSTFSMGVDFADLNRDGFVDLFTVDMLSRDHVRRMTQVAGGMHASPPPGVIEYRAQVPRNALHLNRGDGTFAEVAFYAGVEASEWSWGPIFLDVDLDGFEDILVANGQLRDFQNGDMAMALESVKTGQGFSFDRVLEVVARFPGLYTPNVAFRNQHDGTFADRGEEWGFARPMISQGMALADLDGDGDLDVVVNNLKQGSGIYRNDSGAPRIAVRLKGAGANPAGVGARIHLLNGTIPDQSQEIIGGGRYLSCDDPMRVFAAGSLTNSMTVEVRWRNGGVSRVTDARANRIYEIAESGSTPPKPGRTEAGLPVRHPLFTDLSAMLHHAHRETPFDDFVRQPLAPRRLGELGPGVAWGDVNGDGWEDLLIGAAKGDVPALFLNRGGRGFDRVTEPPMNRAVGRDQSGLALLGDTLVAGSSNWEDGRTNGGAIRLYDFRRKASGESLLGVDAATGPVCLADIDGDGDLDLFVGGRAIAGRYPEPATSRIYRNDGGRFTVAQSLDKVGLVSGAVFSDLDGDGDPDLVLACDWGPVRIFLNEGGRFTECDLGLGRYTGWWNSVTTGDIDGDGRLDILAGNWGLNHPDRATPASPHRVYFGDLRGEGGVDLVETELDPVSGRELPVRNLMVMGRILPFLRETAGTFEAYGRATVQELYGERLGTLRHLEITTTESMLFLNRGGSFEAHPLPREAQWAPVFGLCVADVDGDGHEDVVLAQNFFGVAGDGWRQDAGRGLVLLGDGRGGLTAWHGSGLAVYGEGRGVAVADFDADGRWDVVVAQNSADTLLYHNEGARPGVRVRLKGRPGNESAIGAQVRGGSPGAWGPVRELKAGQGYWSQDGAVQVLTGPDIPSRVAVRWPGSTGWITNAVPADTRDFTLSAP